MSTELNNLIEVMADLNKWGNPSYRLKRVNLKKGRYYIKPGRSKPFMFQSVTSVLGVSTPLPEAIIKKMCEVGYQNWKQYLNERATYGTIMHILAADHLINEGTDFDALGEKLYNIFERFKVSSELWFSWYEDLNQDLIAFAQFCVDYNVRPLLIEAPLASEAYGFAGTLDIVCDITISEKGFWGETYKTGERKGEAKETKADVEYLAVIDLKSGRHGHTAQHAEQLRLCEMLLRENYPERTSGKIIKLFNWSPRDWRSEASYSLTDQTDKNTDESVIHRLALARIDSGDLTKSPTYLKTFGYLPLGQDPATIWDFAPVFEFE